MKILIAVDGSIYTDHALEFLASREGFLASSPEIEMLSVVPQIPAGALRFIERETLEGYYKDCSEKIFKPIRKFLKGKDLPVEEVYVVGDPSEGIADEVDRTKPDLVVMGSRGRSSLKGLFLGSVTRGVLARALFERQPLREAQLLQRRPRRHFGCETLPPFDLPQGQRGVDVCPSCQFQGQCGDVAVQVLLDEKACFLV